MKKCNFCNVFIKDNTEQCPLCGGVLEGNEPGVDVYPNVLKKEKAISFIFRLMLFIALVSVITCIGINITTGLSVKWSLIVTFSFLYLLVILYMFVKENAGYRVRTYVIAVAGVLLVIAIDCILGFRRWSVNYIIPIVIIYLNIAYIILMIVNRRNWQSYILPVLAMVPISALPILLYRFEIVTNPYPTQVAFGFSLFLSLGVVILGGPRAKAELYRRFHILGK